MRWIDILGVIGCVLLIVKIGIHLFIKRKIDKKFDIGPSFNMLNPELFAPIFDDVTGYSKVLRKFGNIIYLISIVLILIYIVGINIR